MVRLHPPSLLTQRGCASIGHAVLQGCVQRSNLDGSTLSDMFRALSRFSKSKHHRSSRMRNPPEEGKPMIARSSSMLRPSMYGYSNRETSESCREIDQKPIGPGRLPIKIHTPYVCQSQSCLPPCMCTWTSLLEQHPFSTFYKWSRTKKDFRRVSKDSAS